MTSFGSRIRVYYVGLFLALSLVIGGGTEQGLITDFVLQVLALPMVFSFVLTVGRLTTDRLVNAFIGSLACLFILQLLVALLPGDFFGLATVGAGRTLSSANFCLVLVAVFFVILQLDVHEKNRLVPFFLLGVFLNFSVALLQFSSPRLTGKYPFLPFEAGAGFFANSNHLSSLLYVAIPFVIFAFKDTKWSLVSVPLVALIVMMQFIVGSHAGVLLSFLCVLISYAFLSHIRAFLSISLAVAAIGVPTTFLILPNIIQSETTYPLNRVVYAQNTLRAILDHLPFGSGLGTFPLIYPQYEQRTEIFSEYVNHAHNDYLEIILEGGVFSIMLLLLYGFIICNRAFRNNLDGIQLVAICGIMFLLIHSTVDYPLRTMALGIVFAFLNALFLLTTNPLRQP